MRPHGVRGSARLLSMSYRELWRLAYSFWLLAFGFWDDLAWFFFFFFWAIWDEMTRAES